MYCTDVLRAACQQGKIHPIFEPVWMHPENSRPYLVRAIPGDSFGNYIEEKGHSDTMILQNFLSTFLNPYLKKRLRDLGFTDKTEQFDLKPDNFLMNPALRSILEEEDTQRKLYNLANQKTSKRYQDFLALLSQWYEAGAHIYLFDYGTWIKPDGTDKYNNKMRKVEEGLPS